MDQYNFKPINVNIKLIESYCQHGEIDLLKQIDFTIFTKQQIKEIIDNHNVYIQFIHDNTNYQAMFTFDVLQKIHACKKFLEQVLQTEFTWQTTHFIIYANSFEGSDEIVYKIQDKNTLLYKSVYHSDLITILNNENITIPYFNNNPS